MNFNLALLLLITMVWGTTFPLLKSAASTLSGVEISAIRFAVAGVCMAPFIWKVPRRTWIDGALLGALALVSYVSQAYGMQFISSNRSAFLTSLAVLLVPLLGLFWGGRLSTVVIGAALMACAGIGLMSWEGGAHLLGDSATLLCAVAYALYVIVLSQRSRGHDSRQLTATQIAFMAVFSALWIGLAGIGNDSLGTLGTRLAPHAVPLLYLGVVATAGMLLLQAIAQRHVSADKAAVVYAMEPVFAALFGWLWLGEVLSARAALGGAMVVVAVILSELKPGRVELASLSRKDG
ncbi:DMT family transporter [Rhodoferax sp.]|uniref:DMT family transporter n=1 Tax=Rhodoferax sp. TaxID=50421 RepID=UPI0027748BB6|nr:DMT family transporter [Rhodoferax sp.]